MRTYKEIQREIKALKKLVPIGVHKETTAENIRLAIEELEHGVDTTSGEWLELEPSQQDYVLSTNDWKNKLIKDRPSDGWGILVK